ncbi:hypothetical protein GCM10010441_59110 [Kitasatospora paracochleata]|uniref:Uncharacterized protein n=1 Tax=Kitasatospora paracochleata TaxID=58354 RepID=A0ABT1J2C7_9ACTN|nr:hypothetical protein [Kitasatospora paracochleata]MCP2311309.1 hypothetical protein [Kitasatospora paracochleata]
MGKKASAVLRDLVQPWSVALHSNSGLAGSVAEVSAADDKERRAKNSEPLRRKPGLRAVPVADRGQSIRLTPWKLLHTLGRANVLARQGAGRGLAEHWASLKYCQALSGNHGSFMTLSEEGRNPIRHYKAVQSAELGVGFALVVAQEVLRRRYPDHSVSVVDAEIALRAGWTLTGKEHAAHRASKRPHFLLEVWKPGAPSKVVLVACKGTHSKPARVHAQLSTAAVHVEALHIGRPGEVPAMVFGTELPGTDPITLHLLEAPGDGTLHLPAGAGDVDLDSPPEDRAVVPGIDLAWGTGEKPRTVSGYHVRPEDHGWFRRVLAHADAAGLAAFTGGGEPTARYLSKRQGKRHFEQYTHAGTGIVQDVAYSVHGVPCVGTDHVFRLNGTRVEAFSGVAQDLFDDLAAGRVEDYRHKAHALRTTWPEEQWDTEWNGPVSVNPDGSVLAIRVL